MRKRPLGFDDGFLGLSQPVLSVCEAPLGFGGAFPCLGEFVFRDGKEVFAFLQQDSHRIAIQPFRIHRPASSNVGTLRCLDPNEKGIGNDGKGGPCLLFVAMSTQPWPERLDQVLAVIDNARKFEQKQRNLVDRRPVNQSMETDGQDAGLVDWIERKTTPAVTPELTSLVRPWVLGPSARAMRSCRIRLVEAAINSRTGTRRASIA